MLPLDPSRLRSMGPGAWIREGWNLLQHLPGGPRLFARLLGAAIPYTGALGAEIVALEPGHARVRLRQRRGVQNHLRSIHAIALCNLAEMTGNLALAYTLPDDARFIVTGLSIQYKKKARGVIEAVCRCSPPSSSERQTYRLEVTLSDASGSVVSTAVLETLVGPITTPREAG